MPILAKLLQSAVNPRKVITRRDLKLVEYGRYVALRDARKPIEKATSQSAQDFIALHSQLVQELPTFLEGYARILDVGITAFGQCQARYHFRIQGILEEFKRRWIALPRHQRERSVELSSPNGESKNGTGREIVKMWHTAWAPYGQALDNFRFTEPSECFWSGVKCSLLTVLTARAFPTRLASFSVPIEREASPNKMKSSATADASPSRAPRPDSPSGSIRSRRARASSLLQKVQASSRSNSPTRVAAASGTHFGVLRGNNRPSKADMANRVARPSSLSISNNDPANRYSFGLPKITADTGKMFEGIGLSPNKASSGQGRTGGLRATSDPHAYADVNVPATVATSNGHAAFGFGSLDKRSPESRLQDEEPKRQDERRPSGSKTKIDAAEGWRNEPVLYQCACVADL